MAASAPGLFTVDYSGQGQAAAVNESGTVNSPSRPAPIGSVISLFATGEGQTSPALSSKPSLPVSVTIANWPDIQTIGGGQLHSVGAAPGEVAGVMQIDFRIPAGIAPGSAVPVSIRVGSRTSQFGVTIAVSGN
jgi:uncharacterized protein (TIGR03437 family)